MGTVKTTHGDAAVGGAPIARDRTHQLLGPVMGLVAVAVGFAALGAYLGRNLRGTTGLVPFLGAFACLFALNIAAAKGNEPVANGLLFGLGLLLGLAGHAASSVRGVRERRCSRNAIAGAEAAVPFPIRSEMARARQARRRSRQTSPGSCRE